MHLQTTKEVRDQHCFGAQSRIHIMYAVPLKRNPSLDTRNFSPCFNKRKNIFNLQCLLFYSALEASSDNYILLTQIKH